MKRPGLIALVGLALLVACLANGSRTYLERIGVASPGQYRQFMDTYCAAPAADGAGLRHPCSCMAKDVPADERLLAARTSMYHARAGEVWLKLLKDGLLLAFLGIGLVLVLARRAPLPARAALAWPLPLAASVAAGFAVSLASNGPLFAAVGLRSFGFLALALLGGWAVFGLDRIARVLGWLLLLELLLVAVELWLGMPLQPCPRSFRAAGSFVLPSTLGVVAVSIVAFRLAFARPRVRVRELAFAGVAGLILLASGSGTGLVMLFAVLSLDALVRLPPARRRMARTASLVIGIALALALPAITHRPDIYDSVFANGGRADKLVQIAERASPLELVVGAGVGVGSNTAYNLANSQLRAHAPGEYATTLAFADSTVTVLFEQLGVIGVLAFYLLLGWAAWRDPKARPFHLAVLLASLTMNVIEVFPLNFLFGLALARALHSTDAESEPDWTRATGTA